MKIDLNDVLNVCHEYYFQSMDKLRATPRVESRREIVDKSAGAMEVCERIQELANGAYKGSGVLIPKDREVKEEDFRLNASVVRRETQPSPTEISSNGEAQ